MKETTMSYENSLRDAKIFLNTFGFILEENTNEILNIYDKNNNIVGKLNKIDNRINISVEYNGLLLEADYYIPKIISFVDFEDDNQLYGQWSSEIFFILKKDNIKMNGEFLISSSLDSEFGHRCVCHPIIRCILDGQVEIDVEILRNGNTFGLNFKTFNTKESIQIKPYDDMNGYIIHDILYGTYDFTRSSYPYRKYSGVFPSSSNEPNKLHAFLHENKYNECIDFKEKKVDKIKPDTCSESIIQKGNLMKELDPKMYKEIKTLLQLFRLEDILLLDNLISVCYDSYTDEEIYALLGIKRKPFVFQNGQTKLKNAYFYNKEQEDKSSSLKMIK